MLLVIGVADDPDDTAKQIALFKEKYGSGRVAVLADHYQLSEVVSAFRAGANAYFTKVTTCNAFIKSLELVMLGETIVPSEILSLIIAHKIAHKSYEANDLKVETDAVVSNDAPPYRFRKRVLCPI
jgi:two-component system nitrate/nitrite response regulator NarL